MSNLLDELWNLSERFVELIRDARQRWTYYPDTPGVRSLSFEELDRHAAAKQELREFVDEEGPRLAAFSVILSAIVQNAPVASGKWHVNQFEDGWNSAVQWITDLLEEEWRKHCSTEMTLSDS